MNDLKYISTAGPIIGPPGWDKPPIDGNAGKICDNSVFSNNCYHWNKQ